MQIKPDASKYFRQMPAALALLSFLFFGFFKLGSTLMNTDAQHWYLRSTNFINAVEKLNFKKTYQDAKPGVPVMWLSGAGMKTMLNLYNSKYGFKPVLYTQETFRLFQISAIGPLVILSFIFLIFYFLLVKKLFNVNTAVFALIFLALHPFYIANARFLHVDAVMTAFASLSFLSFLLFLKEARWRYNIASGILFGLALLTKTQAGFIFPLIIILLTFKYLTEKQKTIIYFSKILFIWTLSSAVAYFAFFPSMWVHPINTVQKVFTEASYVVQTGRTGLWGPLYYFDVLYRELGWPFIILSLSAIIFLVLYLVKRKKIDDFNLFAIALYTIFYFVLMTFIEQKVDRYMLPLFPPVFILCAWTLDNLINSSVKLHSQWLLFLVMLIFSAIYTPHFETFGHNTPGTNTFGALYNEAGNYLNSKPNSDKFTVVAMTKAYSLKPFIKGNTYGFEEDLGKTGKLDYLVTNDYWLSEYGKPWYFNKCSKEKSIYWHGDLYWDIYKCN